MMGNMRIALLTEDADLQRQISEAVILQEKDQEIVVVNSLHAFFQPGLSAYILLYDARLVSREMVSLPELEASMLNAANFNVLLYPQFEENCSALFDLPFHQKLQLPCSLQEIRLLLELAQAQVKLSFHDTTDKLIEMAFHQSASSIVITSPQGIIERVNTTFLKKTGYSETEVLGQHTRMLKSGKQDDAVYIDLWKTISSGQVWRGELLNRRKNGEYFWELLKINPVKRADGEITHFMAIKDDITEQRKAELNLELERQLLRRIIDMVPYYIFIRDEENRYLLANRALASVYGLSPETLVGLKDMDIHPEKDKSMEFYKEDLHVIKTGNSITGEYGLWDSALKTERFFQYSKIPFVLHDTQAILSVWFEITDRINIEKILREERKSLLKILNSLNDAIIIHKLDGEVIYVNDVMLDLFGISTEQSIGLHIAENLSGENYTRSDYDRVIEELKRRGEHRFEWVMRSPERKEEIPVYVYLRLINYDSQEVVMASVTDISEGKRFEQELIAAREEAEKASDAKAEFLSVMSHEIRTPLNAIISMAVVLMDEIRDPEHTENLEILNFSARNLLFLINDILDYSKIEAGKLVLERIDVNLAELSRKTLQSMQMRAREKGVELKLQLDPDIPHLVVGDPVRLGQVLNNLLSNAIKFTDVGHVDLIVKVVKCHKEVCKIFFEVRDTGIGIEPGKIETLFEVFTQASSETTRKYGGTGLGLAIIKKLLALHKSTIKVESSPGLGSSFSFEIEFDVKARVPEKEMPVEAVFDQESLKGIEILMVEDNAMNIMVARKIFKKWGCDLNVAENGQVAMELVRQRRFDFIFMDLQMPVMDGFETTRQIRLLDDFYRKVPIVALTAAVGGEVRQNILDAGMNDIVSKPFDSKVLLSKIQTYLELEDRSSVSTSMSHVVNVGVEFYPERARLKILTLLKEVASTCGEKEMDRVFEEIKALKQQKEEIFALEILKPLVEKTDTLLRIEHNYRGDNRELLLQNLLQEIHHMCLGLIKEIFLKQ